MRHSSPDTGTTAFTYDGAGRLLRMTYPSGAGLSGGYDAFGRLASVGSLPAVMPVLAISFLYQPPSDRRFA